MSVETAEPLARLRRCAVSPESSLLAMAIRAGRFKRALEVNPNKEKERSDNEVPQSNITNVKSKRRWNKCTKCQETHAQASIRGLVQTFLINA